MSAGGRLLKARAGLWHTARMPRSSLLASTSGSLVRLALALSLVAASAGCNDKVPEPDSTPKVERKPAAKDEFKAEDVVVGTGAEAKDGSTVKVQYTGTLKNGTKFDSSRDRNEPFEFTLGKGQVIKGWDKGVVGMKVGGKRKLTIPSELGYGDKGSPPKIPGKATLVFEVELLAVNETPDAGAADAGGSDAGDGKKKDKKSK